jgi:CBS domain-containing protein
MLANKGRIVMTTGPERTLQEVSLELMRHNIGALVVVDANDGVVGPVSERDVVAAVANHGPNALLDAVARHMTENPIVAAEEDTVDSSMEAMRLRRQRHLPVVHNGRLTGLVSIGDVGEYRIDQIEHERRALHNYLSVHKSFNIFVALATRK